MTSSPPKPFYDAPIDRNHSVAFSYTADTTSRDLIELSESIWSSFPEETRAKINPTGRNSRASGLPTLRLIVVQLFGVWITDPTQALATPRGNNLKVKSIYNPKAINPEKLRAVLDALEANNYIDTIAHSHSDNPNQKNTTSRARATKKLQELFNTLTTTEFDIIEDPNTPLVKLNEFDVDPETGDQLKTKHPVEYDQTLPHVVEMVKVLRAYNDLLNRTHIHLASIDKPYITRIEKKTGKEINVQITNASKTVRRVFSRGKWDCFGRFSGGFWQRVGDKEESPYRRNIRINNEPTVELDYSSLHPNILTVEAGLEPLEDVYTIDYQVDEQFDQLEQRQIMKGLVLNLLNAKTSELAYSAFRYNKPVKHPFKKLSNGRLEVYTTALTKKNPHLADKIGNDEGIRLMFIDSQIMNVIINKATTKDVPILTVHDSVICREKDEPYVRRLMREATKQVVGVELNFDVNRESVNKAISSKTFRDRDFSNRLFQHALETSPKRETTYHINHLKRFQEHINKTKT
tara:strand:- start:1483 stop:3039 length:1557 start_codon:yes stop_codon:yes gene_type:complete